MSNLNCALCSEPVNLSIDLACDETGKVVHEQCYVDRIKGEKIRLPPPAFEKYVAPAGLRPEQHAMTCGAVRNDLRPLNAVMNEIKIRSESGRLQQTSDSSLLARKQDHGKFLQIGTP
jgi:hypothetical protein